MLFPDLAEGAEQHVHRRAIHGSAHQQREKEAGSAIKRARNDLNFVHQYEAHGGVCQAPVGVQQSNDHRHIRCSDGNDQEKAKQQSQTDDYEEQRTRRRHEDQIDERANHRGEEGNIENVLSPVGDGRSREQSLKLPRRH